MKYFDGKTYAWVGLSQQKSIFGKVCIFLGAFFLPISQLHQLDKGHLSALHLNADPVTSFDCISCILIRKVGLEQSLEALHLLHGY